MGNKYNKLDTVIVSDTGEIKTYEQIAFEYIKNTYPSEQTKKEKVKNYLQKQKSKDNFNKSLNIHCGTFFFNYYSDILDKEHIFRFIYLCSLTNYDNIIMWGNSKGDKGRATKKDLQEILNLSDKQFYSTINYLVSKEMIIIREDEVEVSKNICRRGKIKGNQEEGVIRMFDKAIKELYEKATVKEHGKLGVFIKLLPYIHYKTNVVCFNPDIENMEDVKPHNLTTLSKELGYSTPQRLKKGLMDVKINGESVIMVATINQKSMIVINPRLYYRGDNIEELVGIINLFKMADNKKN